MAKQMNISFKPTQQEEQLYTWLKAKMSTGAYTKDLLYREYLKELNGDTQPITTQPVVKKETIIAALETSETDFEDGSWGVD